MNSSSIKEKPESEAKSAPSSGRPNLETIQIANWTVRGYGRYAPCIQILKHRFYAALNIFGLSIGERYRPCKIFHSERQVRA